MLAVGEDGASTIAAWLRSRGWTVEDVTSDSDWRRRDVDLLVSGIKRNQQHTVEIKTDTHDSGNIYLELSVGKNPGCVFKSRAEIWAYWFPNQGRLYLMQLPKLQLWLVEHVKEYPLKYVRSKQGKRRWSATGIAVPALTLVEAGIAGEFLLHDTRHTTDDATGRERETA